MTGDMGRQGGDRIEPTPTRPAFVRPATLDDDARLRLLRAGAFDEVESARGGAMYMERHAAAVPVLQADRSDKTRRVWLGGLAGVELGYLMGAVVPLPSGATVGVIEGIYVDRAARGCGIGEAMMSVALEWFRSHGCVGVEATALPGQRDTKNFFEEHGLKARLLTVYRSLAEDPS